MIFEIIIGIAVSASLAVYLIVTLLHPERF